MTNPAPLPGRKLPFETIDPPAPLPGAEMLSTTPTVDDLYDLFPGSADKPLTTVIPAAEVPQPYHRLLVHTHHMTVTVEEFYQSPVDVQVLDCRRDGNEYARKILLKARTTGRVVQFGLVQIDLGVCPEPVRREILEGRTPLGRVLIRNEMLRRIEPVGYLRVSLSPQMAGWFSAEAGTTTYGRLGVIYTGERPVVEVLEVLAPVSPAVT
jgi:chorismate-pyruvate lyase